MLANREYIDGMTGIAMQIEYDLTLSDARLALAEWCYDANAPLTLKRVGQGVMFCAPWAFLLYRLYRDFRPEMLRSGSNVTTIICLAFCGLFMLGLPGRWDNDWRLRRDTVFGRNTVTIDSDGLEWRRSTTSQSVTWSCIVAIARVPSAIIISVVDDQRIYIPVSGFASLNDVDAFYAAANNFQKSIGPVSELVAQDPSAWPPAPAYLRQTAGLLDSRELGQTLSAISEPPLAYELTLEDFRSRHWYAFWRSAVGALGSAITVLLSAFIFLATGWLLVSLACLVIPMLLALAPTYKYEVRRFQLRQRRITVATDFERCVVTTDESCTNSAMRDFRRVERNRNGDIYLTPLGGKPVIIPLRAFADRTASDAFYERFREAWKQARGA